ncbi:MAG: CPBP family intramembrane glutamic endopeptidase [Gemmatimonadota bacterium]
MNEGWRQWFVRDGRLRALWRALLFVAAFMAILQLQLLLLPVLAVPVAADRVSAGLVVQGFMLLSAAVLAGWAMLRWVDERPLAELGFALRKRVPLELVAGTGIGAGALGLVVLAVAAFGGYRYTPDAGSAAAWLATAGAGLAVFAIPAAAEEALFRGYLFRTLIEGAGTAVAIVVTSLLFTLVHGANPNVTGFGLVNIFLAGVLLAVAVLRTGSLWFATAVHLGWNWAMAGPLDLPVSGIAGYDMPLYDGRAAGPAWLTGGEFGPEGGLVGTGAAGLALALVLWTTRPGARLAGPNRDGRDDRGEDR